MSMEIFALLLSFPGAVILSALYRVLLLKAISRFRWIPTLFAPASYIVLGLLAAEIILLAKFGAVRSRGLVGPSFAVAHAIVYLLGTPALANLLVFRGVSKATARWYVVVPLCSVLAWFLVFVEYDVSDQLYGPDGIGGPYSSGQ
jgi:hypothetical protein